MENKCSCIVCKKVCSYRGIHTHYYRSHGTDLEKSKFCFGNHGKYDQVKAKANVKRTQREEVYIKLENKCRFCQSNIPFKRDRNLFCNASCNAQFWNNKRKESGYVVPEETRKKISESCSGKTYRVTRLLKCTSCEKDFDLFCSKFKLPKVIKCKECKDFNRRKPRKQTQLETTSLKDYRLLSSFKFKLRDFPDEFDFEMIKEFGWYKASNHGNNLSGVSRDHMVSVRDGFDNKIDPKIIAHPANCQLLPHRKNTSKGFRSSISIEELYERIKNWDAKYKV